MAVTTQSQLEPPKVRDRSPEGGFTSRTSSRGRIMIGASGLGQKLSVVDVEEAWLWYLESVVSDRAESRR